MKKYLIVFKLSWARQLEYRFNFLLGRLRNIIILLLLFYVWRSLTYATGTFAGYSNLELITYIFGINILRSVIFGSQSIETAREINEGSFSIYLIKPVNYFFYVFAREMAERMINVAAAIFEIIIFILILDVKIFLQTNFNLLFLFLISSVFALILYFILSYLISLIAFWSRECFGPRFLFEWFLEFASGAYFPLDILPKLFFKALSFMPFMYIIYLPMSIYLGKYNFSQIITGMSLQVFWIVVFSIITYFVWCKGLKRYVGEGM